MSNVYSPFTYQVDPTRNPADGVALGAFTEEVNYVNADGTATYYGVASPDHPVLIKSVTHVVKAGFGASALIDVGDGSDVDFFLANTAIAENTAGNVVTSAVQAYRTASFQVKVTLSGTRTGGEGKLLVEMLRF
jgi:hypothetical protein